MSRPRRHFVLSFVTTIFRTSIYLSGVNYSQSDNNLIDSSDKTLCRKDKPFSCVWVKLNRALASAKFYFWYPALPMFYINHNIEQQSFVELAKAGMQHRKGLQTKTLLRKMGEVNFAQMTSRCKKALQNRAKQLLGSEDLS
ncbi:uncharacterized protein PHALS_11317 [Plasmopara halstedii]|uniref:Uncharacterized protein n=1 Tax=Plasmopara halstedii TaxID=4781 RepID=A0A0P1AJ10_PLAHL|nr:uncharacterized protein PHALS_11317 [Plasmopara halstedii]CEG41154.1 hypothetical protein PHALS_11317 [Plasmopara halstedii]|eukprot:XP_024577523.1 hypothetical protein PHALS_11317 [Plasmopara halstedii]